jgi:hypothetical protein
MKKTKIIVLIALVLALIIVGVVFILMSSGTKGFYKKACKISIPFQEKIKDFYGLTGGSDLGFYNDIDECIEDSMNMEADMYQECMENKQDEKECEQTIKEWHELVSQALTRNGCEDLYGGVQCAYYEEGDIDYNYCMDEIKELCEDLPQEF